jgi:hypothetical protein
MSLAIDKPLRFTSTQLSRKVLNVDIDYTGACWEQWFLLSSDRHHDNQHCDQALELKHLKQAQQRGAGIFDFGDLSCAMNGRWDRRKDQDQLREELRGNNYLDRLVNYNADFYEPFANNFVMMTPGNHETAILKHHDTNIVERIAERINAKAGSSIRVGTYNGYVRFRVHFSKTRIGSVLLGYHHGWGGGGPVTKGTIQANRMAVFLVDADIIYCGHIHEEWQVTYRRERMLYNGETELQDQIHVRGAGYKEEYMCGEGYHIESGRGPKPNGAQWLRLYVDPGDASSGRVRFEIVSAK